MVADAIVEHIKLCNWKIERGPPWGRVCGVLDPGGRGIDISMAIFRTPLKDSLQLKVARALFDFVFLGLSPVWRRSAAFVVGYRQRRAAMDTASFGRFCTRRRDRSLRKGRRPECLGPSRTLHRR